MFVENPVIKKIRFEDYDKYFASLIDSPDDSHIIFYRRDGERFTISFSYDEFIIITSITIEQIRERYEDQLEQPTRGEPFEVATDDTGDDPAVRKFIAEYLSRGIPEVD